ncbi:MAG: phosphoribosylformylglycinamidine synthase [Bacillota bacterium]|nr:MAG: phosphoribosylformylglycinamidine synthase [Bacillota bacterium]
MVFRVYVEKKGKFEKEGRALRAELSELLEIKGLRKVRVLNRYDAENIDKELFEQAVKTVFSEPQTDIASDKLDKGAAKHVFAVEYLPGQFDQRADSAAQCIGLISCKEKPIVRSAKVYLLYGNLTEEQVDAVKKYVINPVEAREADLKEYETLKAEYPVPAEVETVEGFTSLDDAGLEAFVKKYALAMDAADAAFCRDYFRRENREPTITEIRMLDTYWSDHCRHTTFLTTVDKAEFEDAEIEKTYREYLAARERLGRTKPVNLMDIATLAAKELKKNGKLDKLDESEEINACTVKIKVTVDGEEQDWLLLFKNETHNHPTEIEPFGGAATCIGGAIRDPLSGRSYVYAAMRVTGAGNPLTPVKDAMKGKLPQRKIVTTAAAGYSSYGNQIGLATGLVDEIYHEGYVAKRMEIGAVVGAAPAENVVRKTPEKGDVVILLGGRTGRDGCGGATGSSKSHTASSLTTCGAEVQKGNAPEERKLQRLFRNGAATRLIKRCNDFGAGGVSVAIGELADGLVIDLNAVPKKYEGLDGTELAISESQERMAVVVAAEDADVFKAFAEGENLEATTVARVTDDNRLTMLWNGKKIVDISRDFLNSNGAEKHTEVLVKQPENFAKAKKTGFLKNLRALAQDLNVCSKRGLVERFDSTIGANTVLMPYGGTYQRTPSQAMAHKVAVEKGNADDCSVMSYGYNPFISEKSPYHGAYLAVVESVSKLVAAGAKFEDVYLTFQEYFEKPMKDAARWGKPFAALLGAYKAQNDYEIGAIGGKDSMSGTFEHIDVPPTLVSFAVTTAKGEDIVSAEFKKAGNKVLWLKPEYDGRGIPSAESEKALFAKVRALAESKKAVAVYTPTYGGAAEAVMKMCFGNMLGFAFAENVKAEELFQYRYGSFIVEIEGEAEGEILGTVTAEREIVCGGERADLDRLYELYARKLEPVFPTKTDAFARIMPSFSSAAGQRPSAAVKTARPSVLIPVFPGTNCEYDTAKAFENAGVKSEIFVINNLTAEGVSRSVDAFAKKINESNIVFIPGGFSGGDEPDGSGKFITAFFRNAAVKEAVENLLERRDGLMGGICNGFQALVKMGLVPYGKILDMEEDMPTLTFNDIGRHQSRLVNVRVTSNRSPWFKNTSVGEIYSVPISHGEGKFAADAKTLLKLGQNGQIATQYVDLKGDPSMDVDFNPAGSLFAIEGVTSPDGRVFGKMGHSERIGKNLYKNVCGKFDMKLFESAAEYFK